MKKFSFLLIALVSWAVSTGQTFPEPMRPAVLVNDFAGIFSLQERLALEHKLEDFERTSSTQIAVVTVTDLQGFDPGDYAARLFDRWGIGGRGKDNGALILVKPKTEAERGQVFISTGYGLEGAVPDALAGRIVDYDILPAFREGNYYKGVDNAVNTLVSLTKGEFTADQYIEKHEGEDFSGIISAFLIFLIPVFLLVILAKRGGKGGGGSRTISSSGDNLTRAILWGALLGGGRSSGGSSGGGFGGFGGFGGGMTGGGGAGGSW
ncbi:MAG: TPM domain-containing protein [Rikenellaceae bacterium]|jgi:uncharacterized protein|nr:TPM domain-containing protein [Rikenellaceae bacterium]